MRTLTYEYQGRPAGVSRHSRMLSITELQTAPNTASSLAPHKLPQRQARVRYKNQKRSRLRTQTYTVHISNTEDNNYTQFSIFKLHKAAARYLFTPSSTSPFLDHSVLYHNNLFKTSASAVLKSHIHPEHTQTPTGLTHQKPITSQQQPLQSYDRRSGARSARFKKRLSRHSVRCRLCGSSAYQIIFKLPLWSRRLQSGFITSGMCSDDLQTIILIAL